MTDFGVEEAAAALCAALVEENARVERLVARHFPKAAA